MSIIFSINRMSFKHLLVVQKKFKEIKNIRINYYFFGMLKQ